MKKICLFIITLFFCITVVDAKTYSSYEKGAAVHLNKGNTAAEWRVIEDSDSRNSIVKLIRRYDTDPIKQLKFGGEDNNYENSTMKTAVDNFGVNLGLGTDLIYIGVINLQELQTIGCIKQGTTIDCSNVPASEEEDWTWIYKTSNWTSIPVDNTTDYVYYIQANSPILQTKKVVNEQGSMSVKPVIIVKKESVTGNVTTNEERNFNDFSISCNKELTGTEEFECYIKMDKDIQNMNFDLSIEGLSLIENFSIENITWNESFQTGVDNNGIYEIKNNTLTKIASSKDSDNLLKITGKVKDLKEDGKLTIKLTNLSISDELGDYQNINEVTKEIKILKTEKRQDLIENPNTGIQNITIVLLIILAILSLSITISIIIKHNKKKIQNK